MAETAGPILEGSANFTPPKKGFVEKMKQKASEVKLSETATKVRDRVVNRLKQNTGEIVEQKWMDAYQKTVDALDPGKRKKVLEKLHIVAVGMAKFQRYGAAFSDIFLQIQGGWDVASGGLGVALAGRRINAASVKANELRAAELHQAYEAGASIGEKINNPKLDRLDALVQKGAGPLRVEGALNVGKGVVEATLGTARINRVASGWIADISGMGGEKIAQITNKILRGKPKVETAAA